MSLRGLLTPLRLALALLALLFGAYLALAYGPAWAAAAPAPLPPPLRAYFTTPDLRYPDDPAARRSALLDAIVADVDAARQSVALAMFDLDTPQLTAALLRAIRRGVTVRAAIDSENLDAPEAALAAGRLQRAGAQVTFDRREPFQHNKVLVLDGAVVWVGSWNATDNDTFRNNNNMLRLVSRPLAAGYSRDLDALLAGRSDSSKATPPLKTTLGAVPVEAYWSPQGGAQQRLVALIGAARHSLRVLAFSFTADPVVSAVEAAARRGVPVSVVLEAKNAAGTGSQLKRLRAAGEALEDGNCYNLHHKVMIIDERIVVTGSYNFTNSAEQSHAETMLVVEDPAVAQAYLAEFARVRDQALTPTRC